MNFDAVIHIFIQTKYFLNRLANGRPHTRAISQPLRSGQQPVAPQAILSPLKAAKVSTTIAAAHNKEKDSVPTKRTTRTTSITKRYD